jgi:hypothetical protein
VRLADSEIFHCVSCVGRRKRLPTPVNGPQDAVDEARSARAHFLLGQLYVFVHGSVGRRAKKEQVVHPDAQDNLQRPLHRLEIAVIERVQQEIKPALPPRDARHVLLHLAAPARIQLTPYIGVQLAHVCPIALDALELLQGGLSIGQRSG